jgi:regulator of protease activity HflC (stomatin/prohibitin superfamily)
MKKETPARSMPGGGMLLLVVFLYIAFVALFIRAISREDLGALLLSFPLLLAAILGTSGFFIINPNEAAALLLLGRYKGTERTNGFRWTNPFVRKRKVSLRARNLNGERLKVNDSDAKPVEIAVVVVWRVEDTFKALFEVDDYVEYVRTQSESAVRHLASSYPYDGDDDQLSLRGSTEELNDHLNRELSARLELAGVEVVESRIAHLAYAPEIASAMLQRQQAAAVVSARRQIVDGAVGMVEMALDQLGEKEIVALDEERKAAMVSNLLVVLCSDHAAQPVVNAGTLYT